MRLTLMRCRTKEIKLLFENKICKLIRWTALNTNISSYYRIRLKVVFVSHSSFIHLIMQETAIAFEPVDSKPGHNYSDLKMKIKRKPGCNKTRQVKHEVVLSQSNNNSETVPAKHFKLKKTKGNHDIDMNSKQNDPYTFGVNDDNDIQIKKPKMDNNRISTKEIGANTVSLGTMTDPNFLGPCDPGTNIVLNGVVWLETSTGILVVNVSWRGRSYVGSLMDTTKHDFAPLNLREYVSPIETAFNPRGRKRRKLRVSHWSRKPNKLRNHLTSSRFMNNSNGAVPNANQQSNNVRNLDECPIACPHQSCSKKFVNVTALRYHLNQCHPVTKSIKRQRHLSGSSRNIHDGVFKSPIKIPLSCSSSASSFTNRGPPLSSMKPDKVTNEAATSPLPPSFINCNNNPVPRLVDPASSHAPLPSSIIPTHSSDIPPVTLLSGNQNCVSSSSAGSVTLTSKKSDNSHQLINADSVLNLSALSTGQSCPPTLLTSVSNNSTVLIPLPVVSNNKLSSSYLIDGVSPVSSVSSLQESPIEKSKVNRNLNAMPSPLDSLPLHCNGYNLPPRSDSRDRASPAYSDISDSNDCPAPVLEKERIDPISVPSTPPFMTQPPPLLPATTTPSKENVGFTTSSNNSISESFNSSTNCCYPKGSKLVPQPQINRSLSIPQNLLNVTQHGGLVGITGPLNMSIHANSPNNQHMVSKRNIENGKSTKVNPPILPAPSEQLPSILNSEFRQAHSANPAFLPNHFTQVSANASRAHFRNQMK